MSDALVARLREGAQWLPRPTHDTCAALMTDATDRIEQLEAERDALRETLREVLEALREVLVTLTRAQVSTYEQWPALLDPEDGSESPGRHRGEAASTGPPLRAVDTPRGRRAMSATTGVWVVMGQDWKAFPLAVFPDELAARRWADEYGDGEVYWWPWGPWDNATKDRHEEVPDE